MPAERRAHLLAGRQRVVNVAGVHPDDQRRALSAPGDVEGPAARGALDLVAAGDVYAAGRGVDPGEQLRVDAAATERARAGGFSGLHVAAEITPLLADRAGREAFSGGPGVAGGVDAFRAGVLRSLLEGALPERPCDIDLAGVESVEHKGLLAIDGAVHGRGAVEVRAPPLSAGPRPGGHTA